MGRSFQVFGKFISNVCLIPLPDPVIFLFFLLLSRLALMSSPVPTPFFSLLSTILPPPLQQRRQAQLERALQETQEQLQQAMNLLKSIENQAGEPNPDLTKLLARLQMVEGGRSLRQCLWFCLLTHYLPFLVSFSTFPQPHSNATLTNLYRISKTSSSSISKYNKEVEFSRTHYRQ